MRSERTSATFYAKGDTLRAFFTTGLYTGWLTRQTRTVITRDEGQRVRFGWKMLRWLLSQMSGQEHAQGLNFLRGQAKLLSERQEVLFAGCHETREDARDGFASLGVLDAQMFDEIQAQALSQVVIPCTWALLADEFSDVANIASLR